MKGQAFIVFKDVNSATNAKHALDKTSLFGKPMKLAYAKTISDVILQHSNKLTLKDKLKKDEERRHRREQEYLEIKKKIKYTGVKIEKVIGRGVAASFLQDNINININNNLNINSTSLNTAPNNTLFVQNLPSEITEPVLRAVFSKYNGFKEVRLFSGKGIAFVEYDNEINAGGALIGLNGLNLTSDCTLQISFAKK